MGATNALARPQAHAAEACDLDAHGGNLCAAFADADGRVRATFEFLWLSGWAPHPSQQRPLRPGSAQARLADALGTREHSAGEKAGN